MIGQFVARFVGGLPAWRLAFAMVVLPTIPLGLWFSVLYIYFQNDIVIPAWLNNLMIFVGIVFVVTSLDSLIRLYTANLGWGIDRIPPRLYYPLHFCMQLGLVLAYFFTPFRIEWVGLVVIGIYIFVYTVVFRRMALVREATAEP
jgi:choline-glycine betaine transporter